jgi:DNA modification methylase
MYLSFVEKKDFNTFYTNKKIVKSQKTNQNFYETKGFINYIEAANNDETQDLNKATYSVELCEKLLNMYAPPNALVYDPFIGTGTTAVACIKNNLRYIGTELSEAQCNHAKNRIKNISKSNVTSIF